MDKRDVIQDMHAMIDARLFGSRPWLLDQDTAEAVERKLDDLGLWERIPADVHTWQTTSLGRELKADLVIIFVGLLEVWEAICTLEDYGLLDESDASHICDLMETRDPEIVLRPYVQKAYRQHYNPSGPIVVELLPPRFTPCKPLTCG